MFVQMPPGLEEGPAAPGLVAPPPGLPQHLPVCGPPPGLERPAPCVGDVFLALSRGEQVAVGPVARKADVRPATPETPKAPASPDAGKKTAGGPLLKLTEALTSNCGSPVGEDVAESKAVLDLLRSDTEAEALLRPLLDDVMGRGQLRGKGGKPAAGNNSRTRWWSRPDLPLLCPLTRFPICLLPYPPFKLRIDPKRSSPHRLVDGKFLAIHYIANGNASACGRELEASDLSALDDYVHRCKLGPFRPGRAHALAQEAASAEAPQRRAQAVEERERFVAAARAELGKLRRIQENRLLQISKALPADAAGHKSQPNRSRVSSGASTASTVASSTGGDL